MFNTGVDNGGTPLAAGSIDPHYRLVVNPNSASADSILHNEGFPIAPAGPWIASSSTSKWIAPVADTSAAAGGDYTYRLTFDLTGLDANTATISGQWATDNAGVDILINGVSTGNSNVTQFTAYTPFAVTNGFISGTNTLDFVVNNASAGFTGLRVELSGIALPPGSPPVIVSQPKSQCVSEGQPVSFSVTAQGNPAPTYRWRHGGNDLPGETNATLAIASAAPVDAGNYDVVVTNPSGSVTSVVVTLTVGLFMVNPSFEADTFTVFPGYVSGNGPITGWNARFSHGINPGVGFSPFADNGAIPHGRQVAFMQEDGPMSQQVSGFVVGEAYYVRYYENARDGNVPALALTVQEGSHPPITIVSPHIVNSVGGSNPYHEVISEAFVATAPEMTLSFVKSNPRGGDNTVLIDNVCVVQIQSNLPPFITRQPEDLDVDVCDPAMLSVTAIGGLPLRYQWRKDGSSLSGGTNSTLAFAMVSELDEGAYTVVVSNAFGSVTSRVARLVVFEPIPDLFNTGVDSNAEALSDNSIDPHYILFVNPDAISTFNAIVQDSTVFPIASGPWLANTPSSKWIGPRLDTSAAAAGIYTYRTRIDLTGRDPTTVVIFGRWATDNSGTDIRVNGVPTGNPQSPGFDGYTSFVIASSNATFIPGPNTIDFVVDNAAAGYTGLRVEIDKSNVKIPPGTAPTITRQPRPGSLKVAVGDTVVIEAKAAGSAPLSYQWKRDNIDLPGQTQPTLTLSGVTTADSANYTVGVTNSAGSTLSETAVVCVCFTVMPGIFGTGVDNNNLLLADGAVDPHYTLTMSADPSYPGPNAFVITEGWPIAPAGPWLANGPSSKWIAPRAEQNQQVDPGFGNQPGNYTFQTTVDLFDVDVGLFALQGRWAVDNGGVNILLNGNATGITSPGFTAYRAFFITNGLIAGLNTMDFAISNAGTGVNPAGLRVDLRGLLTIQPRLSIARQGSQVVISWIPKCPGQQLQCATELRSSGTQWQTIAGATSPHPINANEPMKFSASSNNGHQPV